jgi:GAF domain-containing protein
MRQRSRTGGEPVKTRRRKTVTRKNSNVPKAVRRRSSSAANLRKQLDDRSCELNEALERQAATVEILKIISASPAELQPVLEVVVKSAARFCEADDVTIFELDGQDIRVAAHWGAVPHLGILEIGFRFPCTRGSVAGRTVLERRPVHVSDLQAEAEDFPEGSALARRLGHRTIAGVPLLREEVVVGTIQLRRTEVNPFTDKQIALLEIFAAQAVIAIENTRLLNELRQRTDDLTESLEQQTATADVLRIISSSPTDIQPVLEAIVRTAGKLCDAEYAMLYRLRDGKYHAACWNNAVAEWVKYLLDHPLSVGRGSLVGRTALERRAVHILDCLTDAEYTMHEAARIGNQRTMLGVPLLRDGVPIGVIGLLRTSVKPFTEKQIELVTTFADQAVIAIENTRLLNELRESLQQQTATADVLKVISRSAFDLRTVLQTLVESAARFCNADKATIVREKDGLFYNAEAYGYSREFL